MSFNVLRDASMGYHSYNRLKGNLEAVSIAQIVRIVGNVRGRRGRGGRGSRVVDGADDLGRVDVDGGWEVW